MLPLPNDYLITFSRILSALIETHRFDVVSKGDQMSRPAYHELKLVYFMWKLGYPLVPQGEYWNLYREPSAVASRATLRALVDRGWLERCHKYDCDQHDEFKLTAEGMQAAQAWEVDYLKMIARHINEA